MTLIRKTLPLGIEFGPVRWGLFYFTLKLGHQTFETNFSDVFDPTYRFKHWLEAIAIGVEQCSFTFDPEGNEIRFTFDQVTYDRAEYRVTHPWSDGELLLNGNVDRRQLVGAFYNGFLTYDASPEFDRYQWEAEPTWHVLSVKTGIDLEGLINKLLPYDRSELLSLDTSLKRCDFPAKSDIVGDQLEAWPSELPDRPALWSLADDFDVLSTDRKREALRKALEKPYCCEQRGTSLKELRSPLIDDFLSRA